MAVNLMDSLVVQLLLLTVQLKSAEVARFEDNRAADWGRAIFAEQDSIINMSGNVFVSNNADTGSEGVLFLSSSTITIEASEFQDNNASSGGVLASASSTITIEANEFLDNNATVRGGVLDASFCNITMASSNFANNVSPIGAIIYSLRSVIQHDNIIHSFLLVDNNKADRYAVIYLSDSEFIGNDSENPIFSNNLGSLVAFNSNITFTGYATFVNNTPSQTVSGDFQEGGAITLFQSNVFFDGVCNLEYNHAC